VSNDPNPLLDLIAATLADKGFTVEDLAAHVAGESSTSATSAMTIKEYADRALDGFTINTARSYATHFNHLVNGVERQCECTCSTCVSEFAESGSCHCRCATCKRARAFEAQGGVVISSRSVATLKLEPMVKLVQRMAVKRAMHDNIARARRGLSVKPTTGQGAREMCVQALSTLFARMVEDGLIDRSPANGLKKGTRSASRRRALTDSELAQVFDVVASGGDDPVLDLAITWAEFELGARRGGILTLSVGQLDPVTQLIHLLEKGNRLDAQPCSLQLIEFLLTLAASRGGDACVPGSPHYDPNAPVFYFKDSIPDTPHRVTGRRFDTLHRRVQVALPWANSMSYSGHALRHTIATMVERQAGFETARKMLRHARVRTTDTYTEASTADVARAISAITAQNHPLAGPVE